MKKIGILGRGTMASGIVQIFAEKDYEIIFKSVMGVETPMIKKEPDLSMVFSSYSFFNADYRLCDLHR